MRNFIHKAGTPELELAEHEPSTTVADVASEHGEAGALVFGEDAEEPLDPSLTLEDAGVTPDQHIHVARCRRVTATINFKEDAKPHEFPPNVAMAAVFQWAVGPNGFDLSPTDKAEHMLVVEGTETPVDEDAHLEGYVVDDCAAEFDLVAKHRFEGCA